MRFSEYFVSKKIGEARTFYDAGGKLVTTITFLNDPSGLAPNQFILRQTDARGYWQSDWLLRVEDDGSVTEYGDLYPKGAGFFDAADFWRGRSQLYFRQGYEIRWGLSFSGLAKPDWLRSSFSRWGNGTYFCQVSKIGDDFIDLYSQQSFGRTDRVLYHLERGLGPTAITYYINNAIGDDEVTIKSVGVA